MLIKLWDWEKKWSCSQVFEGHTHYVMQIVINPKDNNQFASASLDRTIKVETNYYCCCDVQCSQYNFVIDWVKWDATALL